MRKVKYLLHCLIVIVLLSVMLTFSGTTNNKKSYYKVSVSTESYVEILFDENKKTEMAIYEEAENLVKQYFEDYNIEFIAPEKVIFGKIIQNNIYGIQDKNSIYIDNTRTQEEIRATIVHELLHLQNPTGFDKQTHFGSIGHNLTEAVIEKITCELTGMPETKRVELLNLWTSKESYQILLQAFIYSQPNLLDDFLDDNTTYKVYYEEIEYSVSKTDYFKIVFDRWMIVENAENIFDKLRGKEEL